MLEGGRCMSGRDATWLGLSENDKRKDRMEKIMNKENEWDHKIIIDRRTLIWWKDLSIGSLVRK